MHPWCTFWQNVLFNTKCSAGHVGLGVRFEGEKSIALALSSSSKDGAVKVLGPIIYTSEKKNAVYSGGESEIREFDETEKDSSSQRHPNLLSLTKKRNLVFFGSELDH